MNTEHTNQSRQAEPAPHSTIDLQSIPARQRGFTAENIRDIAHECMRIGDNEQAEVVFAIADALRDGNLIIQSPAQQQAEPVAPGLYAILYRDNWDGEGDTSHLIARLDENGKWTADVSGAQLMTYEGDAILRVWPLTDDKSQPPAVAVAVPAEWRSPSNTPIVALGDALHCWLAVKSKHDSKVRVYDAYYCNFPLMQDEAGDFPDWTLHDESGEEVAMVGWAEKVAHPDFNDFYSALGDIELIGWQPVNPPAAPTAAQKGGAA